MERGVGKWNRPAVHRNRDPRAVLLEIASMDTAALAKLAQCSMMDALQERRLCAQAALPYIAQKLPTQIDMKSSRAISLNIVSEARYEELVAVAQADDIQTGDDFGLQLIAGAPAAETSNSPMIEGESTAAESDETRGRPEPQHAQTPVSPAVAATSWEKTDGGTFAPKARIVPAPAPLPSQPKPDQRQSDDRVTWLEPANSWWDRK